MPHHLALLDTSRRLRSVVVVGIVVSLLDLALGACAGSRTQLNLAGRPSRLVAAMRSTHDKEAHARRSAEFKAVDRDAVACARLTNAEAEKGFIEL